MNEDGSSDVDDVSPQRCTPKFGSKLPVSSKLLVYGWSSDGIVPAPSAGSRPATTWRTNVPPVQTAPFGSVEVQFSTALPSDCAAIEALKSSEQPLKNLCPRWIVVSMLGGSTSNWPQLGVANVPLPLKP